MKRLRLLAISSGVVFLSAAGCLAQPDDCFAFVRRGDVMLNCAGERTQVTHQGNVSRFAVSDDEAVLGFVARMANKVEKTIVIDLRSGTTKSLPRGGSIVSTCGGLFWLTGPDRAHSDPFELFTGKTIGTLPYRWFRCSSDRSSVIGTETSSGSDLFRTKGLSQGVKIADAKTFDIFRLNISPSGSWIAFSTESRPLCAVSYEGVLVCNKELGASPDLPSVSDTGGVLVATSTDEECYFANDSNFDTAPFAASQKVPADACLGIAYWKPGDGTGRILEPIGRNPQWINNKTARLIREWASKTAGVGQK